MTKRINSQKVARRAHSHWLCALIFMVTVIALSLFVPQNIVAQFQSPAIETNSWGYIMIGKNDLTNTNGDIQELKTEINELKGDGFVKANTTDVATLAKLYQNNPNPFDTQTEIKYYIPSVAINATICFYDMVGAEVLKLEIRGRESGSIVIDAGQLRAGMYMYALLVDGKEIDVKRMILTGK